MLFWPVTNITVLCMVNPFVVLIKKLVKAITIMAVVSIRLWITWSHSSQTVTAGLNWPRRGWQRHRRRSVLRELPRYVGELFFFFFFNHLYGV